MRIKGAIFICTVLVSVLSVLSYSPSAHAEFDRCSLKIINKGGVAVSLSVELADNDFRRRKGLMFRKHLPENQGMLFVFPRDQMLSFWMMNTYIPLSIAYIDSRGFINEIHDMKPLDASVTYPSKRPARYALEVNRGWFSKNAIIPGCRVILNGCLSK